EIAVAREELGAQRVAVAQELARTGSARENLSGRIEGLRARLEELARRPRLVELSEVDDIDLWAMGAGLFGRLSALIDRAEADLVALEIEGLEDRRALAALEDTGLLP